MCRSMYIHINQFDKILEINTWRNNVSHLIIRIALCSYFQSSINKWLVYRIKVSIYSHQLVFCSDLGDPNLTWFYQKNEWASRKVLYFVRGELRRCVRTCACEKTFKTCVRCACVRGFLSWSHTTHVRPHFIGSL